MPPRHIKNISLVTFENTLLRYPSIVPEKLRELDTLRYDTIPAKVAKRGLSAGLEKDEVVRLVEWKLKHGTFRPKLLALVQSNSEDEIKTITKQAVELISQQNDATDLSALKVLVGLSGIGPATASLLLSVMQPKTRPFFSDEMYRWAVWGDEHGITGWKRKIKYSTSEYAIIVKRVEDLRNRLGKDKVSALDAERVAWVLGKEITNINAEEEGEMIDMLEKNTERVTELKDSVEDDHIKPVQSKLKRPTKRKAVDPIVPSEGIRKSTRTRK